MEPSRPIYFKEEGMDFKVTYTLHAATVENWIRRIKEKLLDAAPVKCDGLDYEYTDAVRKARQRNLAPEQRQATPSCNFLWRTRLLSSRYVVLM